MTRDELARASYIAHKNMVEPAWGEEEPAKIWDSVIAREEDGRTLAYWRKRADIILANLPEPKYEWGFRSGLGNDHPLYNETVARQIVAEYDDRTLLRRRASGPWEEVA